MKISRLIVQNYRNIKNIDIRMQRINILIGENNSGKSNLLKAAALPFCPDETEHRAKKLNWSDINNEAKQRYYAYILKHKEKIKNGAVSAAEFASALPGVSVEAILQPEETELYFVKDLAFGAGNSGELLYGIRYEFFHENIKGVMSHVKEILTSEEIDSNNIDAFKMNLLPLDYYMPSIRVPGKGASVSCDILRNFICTPLAARREEFLHAGTKITLEKDCQRFLETLKNLNDKVNNAVLGYAGEYLSSQGAGYGNLISFLVQFQAIAERKPQPFFSLALMEEPETQLSPANKKLLADFISTYMERTDTVQLCYSTHSDTFINKTGFNNVIVLKDGTARTLDAEE